MTRPRTGSSRQRDRRLIDNVCRWFQAHARQMPWRLLPRDPYRALVSEFMLQQTQVSRVLERFGPFMDRFPTLEALAGAPEDQVLAAWSGLGYYRRARHLHRAAREIVARFGGNVPDAPEELLTLPGIGRYTAGAIASIVFGRPVPIVDGNVARVLVRIEGQDMSADEAGGWWGWGRAEALVRQSQSARGGPGAFNEGLMELGAVVCTPRNPRCDQCPLRAQCRARSQGIQGRIPRPKKPAARRAMYCAAVLVEDDRGRVLVERRADDGMWAGLWQAPTLESRRRAAQKTIERWVGATVERVDRFDHGATHRDVCFDVWRAARPVARPGAVWKTRREVAALGLSNPMRRVLIPASRV